jgi:hypothetical protein
LVITAASESSSVTAAPTIGIPAAVVTRPVIEPPCPAAGDAHEQRSIALPPSQVGKRQRKCVRTGRGPMLESAPVSEPARNTSVRLASRVFTGLMNASVVALREAL